MGLFHVFVTLSLKGTVHPKILFNVKLFQTCMSFSLLLNTQKKVFWRMLITSQLMDPI